MIKGMYSAASGVVSNFRRQLVVANNLSNAMTTGYKQDLATLTDFPESLLVMQGGLRTNRSVPNIPLGALGTGTELEEIRLDLSQGDLAETGNPLDLAISGPAFFEVQTPSGTYYTRDGAFRRDALGRLSRVDGGLLLGEDGPIVLGEGEALVDGDGTVSLDGRLVGKIRLVEFNLEDRLLKLGNNYLIPEDPNVQPYPASGSAINQGFLERSNVDLTRAAVEMLSATRSYEASMRMLQIQDQTLERTINEVGKV